MKHYLLCGNVKLSDYKGKWIVFFSHPGDFTPVCTTEIIGFAKAYTYFKKINTELLGISIDSLNSHLAWLYDIYLKTGLIVNFPIIADSTGSLARKYGMISNEVSNSETVRNVFIIDDTGIIRTILIYPMNIGRYIPEILRTVTALQYSKSNSGMTPANWIPGNPMIVPPPRTFEELRKRNEDINKNHVDTIHQYYVLDYLKKQLNINEFEIYLYDKDTIKIEWKFKKD